MVFTVVSCMCRETRFNAMVKEMRRDYIFFCIHWISEEEEKKKEKSF